MKLAFNKIDNNYYAIKILKQNHRISNEKALRNEFSIMKNLSSPSIINLIEFQDAALLQKCNGENRNAIFLALELASGGELFEFLYHTGRFSEYIARSYFHQFIEG